MSPVDKSFINWINEYPESFHPLDMKRFYCFVKNVCRYGRKEKDRKWLINKIDKHGNKLENEIIDIYCDKFEELQKFYKTPVSIG